MHSGATGLILVPALPRVYNFLAIPHILHKQVHYVTYEELANDHTSDVAIKDILRFLGVDDRVAPPALDLTVKQVLPLMADELL